MGTKLFLNGGENKFGVKLEENKKYKYVNMSNLNR